MDYSRRQQILASYPTAGSMTDDGRQSRQPTSLEQVSATKNSNDATSERRRWSGDWWINEITAILFSFIFQGAAVIILLSMSGNPLSRWTFFISLNATIAIFTTAAKATLLLSVTACISQWKWLHFKAAPAMLRDMDIYDEASRGSLGSLSLLLRIRWGIPAIGAIITILALGVDAFTQQVIELDTRQVPSANSSATIAFAHSYVSGQRGTAFNTFSIPSKSTAGSHGDKHSTKALIEYSVDYAMQAAILGGLYGMDQSSLFNCSSSCAWDGPIVSLGFSSTCSNVTAAAEKAKTCITDTLGGQNEKCNMTTPGGIFLNTYIANASTRIVMEVNATRVKPTGFVIDKSTIGPILARIGIYRALNAGDSKTNATAGQEIMECDLSLVGIRLSNVTADGSNLHIGTREIVPLDRGYYNASQSSYIFNSSGLPDLTISDIDLAALMSFFESGSFSGTIYEGSTDFGENRDTIPEGAAGAFLNSDTTTTIDAMAASMSSHVRLASNKQLSSGIVNTPVVFVNVRWEWLSLPIVVEIAAAVLLIITMIKSRRQRNIGLWKSSNVALLYHHVRHSQFTIQTHVQSPQELRILANSVKVKLSES
jgi:hypothetical protein